MDTTNLRCPECNSKVQKLSHEGWVICCAMGHWVGPASECKVIEKVYLKDGSDKTGLIWEWDKLRKLGWSEYEYWTAHALPMGWSIIQVPDRGAEPSPNNGFHADRAGGPDCRIRGGLARPAGEP